MSLTFNEKKATQAAGRLLEQGGSPMNSIKLMKLLYLADREAVLRWGNPVTTDCFVAMRHGPVLGRIYTLVSEGDDPRVAPSAWSAAILRRPDGEVELKDPVDYRQLSKGEADLLDEIFREHGAKTLWDLVDLTRGLPEWRDPQGSAVPFRVQDILAAGRRARTPGPEDEDDLQGVELNFSW